MRKILLFSVIQQLLYHISRVESLMGHQNLIPIRYGEFPFIASFQYFPGEHNFCGGTLISKEHVITLAHCLENISVESIRIVFEVGHAQEPVLTYTVASWTTYNAWARCQGIPYENIIAYNVAIVTLTDKVYHVNPVSLNGLTKRQLDGTVATMIGWKNDVLSKATVKLLSDEDCETHFRVLRNSTSAIDDRVLCTAADPYALLDNYDTGFPLLNAHGNSLLGIGFGFGPSDGLFHTGSTGSVIVK